MAQSDPYLLPLFIKSIHMDPENIRNTIGDHRAIANALKKRLRKLQLNAATLGSSTPPHILVEIEDVEKDIAEHEQAIGEERGLLRRGMKQARIVDLIRQQIRVGNKKGLPALIKKLGNIEGEQYIDIKKLISSEDYVHIQTIFPNGEFLSSAEYVREHLAWLLFPQRSKELSVELLENVRLCIREDIDLAITLEPLITRRIEDEYQLCRRLIPPPYFINVADEISTYCDAFELSSHFHPENKNQIVALFGGKNTGKTETLKYFQQAYPSTSTFYAFTNVQGVEDDLSTFLLKIQESFCRVLLHIFVRYPFTWALLDADHQRQIELAIRQHRSILESEDFGYDPINMIKPWLRGSPDKLIANASESLISMLQGIYKDQSIKNDINIILEQISDIISTLRFTSICIFIDDLNIKWKPPIILRSLNGRIRQYILLRISYDTSETVDPSFLELKWDSDKLGAVFETILGRPNKFDAYPEVGKQFVQQMTVPSDFRVWLMVFEAIYPDGEDITPEVWDCVSKAMHQARKEVSPAESGWSTKVGTRAIAILKEDLS